MGNELGLGMGSAAVVGHQARQTGQRRRRAVRSARRWLRAQASWQPQAGQAATQRPWR